jgi:drug/metabolite transporter (DMT)-like permease
MGKVGNLEEEHMVSRDARRDSTGDPPQEAQQILNTLTQELKNLQQDVVIQLARDVARLQSEKSRLVREIQALQDDRQQALSGDLTIEQMGTVLSSSLDDRQQWVRHLAQSIADRLHTQLAQSSDNADSGDAPSQTQSPGDLHRSLGRSLNASYRHLEGDLADRRSALSQQLRRMENLQQQGEAILTTLIDRMSQQLHSQPEPVWLPPGTSNPPQSSRSEHHRMPLAVASSVEVRSAFAPSMVSPESPLPESPQTQSRISVRKGLILAFLSTALLALFNLSIKLIFQNSTPWGQSQWESWSGILDPSWGNVLLLSFLRMAIIMLLVPGMALWLYPSLWQDLRQLTARSHRVLQGQTLGCGVLLFLSQIFIYRAIGQIPTAVAISLFFIFPVLTIMGGWLLFGERPTLTCWAIGAIVLLGCLFCLPNWGVSGGSSDFFGGDLAAIAGGVAFAGYVLLAQPCTRKLHPIPLSCANFLIAFILSGVGVWLTTAFSGENVEVPSGQEWILLSWGVGLGGFSALSYLCNTLAIRYSGATLSSIVGATIPMLTALCGWLIANEQLPNHQIFGMVLVTIGAIGLSLERLFQSKQNTKRLREIPAELKIKN